MNRRQYLARAGAGLGVVTLAGCVETMSGGSEGADEVAVADRTGERALDRAVGQLNEVALAMAEEDLDDARIEAFDFDASDVREHLERARDHLDTAEAELEGREEDLAELRAYADVLEVLIDVAERIADETITEDIDRVVAALEDGDEADLEDARELVDDGAETLERAQAQFDGAASDLLALDEDRLEDLAIVDLEEIESGIGELSALLDAPIALVSGYDELLAGYDDLEEGRDRADDGDHEAAEAAFTDAERRFAAASGTLEDGKADAPGGLVSYFETALCQSLNLEEAAAEFAEASAAAARRDVTAARRHRENAEDALEAAGSCR